MREWIVTNGLGGYASLTRGQKNTSKFHGLLVASLRPPSERWVFVSNVNDRIQVDGHSYDLNNMQSKFVFNIFPSFVFNFDNISVRKTIFMPYGKNTTIIKFEVSTKKPISIFHRPIINSRHFYELSSPGSVSFDQNLFEHGVFVRPSNIGKTLKIMLKDSKYNSDGYWRKYYYKKDHERQDSYLDNNFYLGEFCKNISSPEEYFFVISIEDIVDADLSYMYSREVLRKKTIFEKSEIPHKYEKLVLSTDNFVVKKGENQSIIAGYHWFGEWGRDTLISLPGTTLVTKRYQDAKNILKCFGRYIRKGLIPNVFSDKDSIASYNTVDSSLWFIDRVYQYLKYTDDVNFLSEIWEKLSSIIDNYKRGTDYFIKMDEDYLIRHGPGLTWMDVKIGDYYPTPRANKAVEIQALWYNALRIMSNFANIIGKDDDYYDLSNQTKESFNIQYDQLYDVIDTKDQTIRPNQVFLVSLDYSMIDQSIKENIINNIELKLITPFGLRTLNPEHPDYKGNYIGIHNRDIAYHNGTAWPWLLGPFVHSFIKLKNYEEYWRTYAYENFLKTMFDAYGDQWDGSIHEIFDGSPPYVPRGCITQAWSVAEILRCLVEDIENIRPPFEKMVLSSKIRA